MTTATQAIVDVPFFRPAIGEEEIAELVACARSGWLTTGPRTKQFEAEFAEFVGGRHAVALNSCTAALHLAVEALQLRAGQGVLVPTMTFAATAEVVRYQGAVPILVDCDPETLNIDLDDAERKLELARTGALPGSQPLEVVGIMPVHVGGLMVDMQGVRHLAERHALWVVEDAAHALPAAFRTRPEESWTRCGAGTAAITCYSFYANKTITTGEGGMAVTDDNGLAARMRQMSLHGLSHDAWNRFSKNAAWDYRIEAPGFKYNLTDLAASLGVHQLRKAEWMRERREKIACDYLEAFADVPAIELPAVHPDRIHSWHLFPIRLHTTELTCSRNEFISALKAAGVGCSVHWRPLHLHPYYADCFGWTGADCPVATREWERLVSLPIFPDLRDDEQEHVIETVRELCAGATIRNGVSRRPRKPR
jgi:perosamine synthetase